MATLFGLLFWEIIFQDKENMFQTAYQRAPLDFGSAFFYEKRKESIEGRLAEILCGDVGAMVAEAWNAHQGRECVGVAWKTFDVAQISTIASCIGAGVVAGVCRVLSHNYHHRRGGMPDLLLWRTPEDAHDAKGACEPADDACRGSQTKDNAGDSRAGTAATATATATAGGGVAPVLARFVEVKSTNDKLSSKQRIWLHVLKSLGVSASAAGSFASCQLVLYRPIVLHMGPSCSGSYFLRVPSVSVC